MERRTLRPRRVAEQIRRELATLLREEVKDPRVRLVTLTGVEVTADYAHATVYFTALSPAESIGEVAAGLEHASGYLRHELGRRIRLHNLPELHFAHDESVERGVRLSRLIDEAVSADRKHEH
ncbi:MAG TPA: 30S ribosome-binding factor RbfA [Rhodocyclaceae bacterium]|nr:MAG: ribosome-binding factor A [Betaproteobacteria bacterium CG2_30_68_42]PIV71806.1 MAG: ribosome-binding factor A [Rhodocyclales bacterium CG17_big_fil_post_rev_8_21_14_2_50_68_7]PIX75485.1 MAG: ribosome-binding factor A [Rhodocyclales bacterium CG_4_10_14_3_um_filter_68_10]PJA57569.1 MAG: ribosome-binding factor A [Rhodocyclales bacterium CG_4_9_14_3_um_filter_68_10]HCX34365.1 30S ribosome-binding factor RbfA [Rhodocyclaceae bacterium]